MQPRLLLWWNLLGGALLLNASAAAQDVSELLRYLPSDANTIAVLRVRELVDSPRGQSEGWAEQHETEFLQGAVTIPPWVDVLVRGSYVRPGTQGGDWTVVVIPLPAEYEMSKLAEREGTEVQEIGERPAVASTRYGGYFVQFGGEGEPRVLGGIAPATRQDAARWVREVGGRGRPQLSEYLSDAAAERSTQIVLAIDLHDMLDPIMVRNRIDSSAVLTRSDPRAALKVDFQSLRGARLTIHTAETTSAEIRLDFGRTLGNEAEHVKPLLIEFLHDAGAELDELEDARVVVQGRSVLLRMPLGDESLRRVMSLVTTPPPPSAPGRQPPVPEPPQPSPSAAQPDLAASRRYFRAVNRIVDDLQRAYGRASSYTRTAHWHITFADRIDRLPTAGVDPALLQYGRDVSNRLRALGASLRGTGVQVNALERSIVYNVQQYPVYPTGFEWWWGGAHTVFGAYTYGRPVAVEVTSNLEEVRRKQAEVVQQSAPERDQIWRMILDDRAATEREMVGKFGSEFQQR